MKTEASDHLHPVLCPIDSSDLRLLDMVCPEEVAPQVGPHMLAYAERTHTYTQSTLEAMSSSVP